MARVTSAGVVEAVTSMCLEGEARRSFEKRASLDYDALQRRSTYKTCDM